MLNISIYIYIHKDPENSFFTKRRYIIVEGVHLPDGKVFLLY